MTDKKFPPNDERAELARSSQYDLWFDGLLDEQQSRLESARVSRDPAQRKHFEDDRAIESSLRRSFGATTVARRGPGGLTLSTPIARPSIPWERYAVAAGLVALVGAAVAIALLPRGQKQADKSAKVVAPLHGEASGRRPLVRPLTADFSLGDVFLDALAFNFEPQLGCQAKDPWDAELFAQLATAPCNQEQGVVVLGEWMDPRVNVANMVMLRRGENPIMLVVPRCEEEAGMCVAKDSGLYVHRGMRDGRTIYEISPLPGSEVLACVDAESVVTQQQL